MTKLGASLVVLTSVALAAPAFGASVYINGVQVDGLANQKFEKVTVSFDAQGNVRIDAPGVEVKTAGGAPAPKEATLAAAPGPVSHHYFLVPQQAQLGMAGFDIDVFINGKWAGRFRNAEEQNPVDVTKFVTGGANRVTFTARKIKGERKSFSPAHTFTVMVGEGMATSDQVVIDNPLVTFKRTAAEAEDATEEFSFTAR